MAVTLDLTISIGTILQTAVIAGGGVAAIVTLRNTVKTLKDQLKADGEDNKEEFKAIREQTGAQFAGVQSELKKMSEILIKQALVEERILNLDRRVTSQGRQIDELRRGEGFIRSHRSAVDGEYGA